METPVDPSPSAVIALDCPWCAEIVLVDDPLPDEIRCSACSVVVAIDTARPDPRVMPVAA